MIFEHLLLFLQLIRETISKIWESWSHEPQPIPREGAHRLFGLLIGINDYVSANFQSLRGAEADAQEWRSFLVQDLGVPDSNSRITMLLGQAATRKNIIEALENLANNDHIEEGDPILIFYAGHGGEVEHRTMDGYERIIQVVVPADFSKEEGKDPVYCITDLEMGGLIDHIAEKKGDNITVIMDCCYSASGTRSDSGDERRVRGGTVRLPSACLNPDIEEEIDRGALRSDYPRAGLRSHMLLAACASTEKAHESNGRGEFSNALLNLFRRVKSVDQLKYSEVLPQMNRISNQNPQCEGVNRDRFFFNGKASRPLYNYHKVQLRDHDTASASLLLDAGSAHGVTVGAQFNIYAEGDTSFTKVIGVATVESLHAFSAIMAYSPGIDRLHPGIALQVKPGESRDFCLLIPPGDQFLIVFKEVVGGDLAAKYQLQNIILVDEDRLTPDAHLQASMGSSDKVTFELKDRRVTQYGFNKQFPTVDGMNLDQVARVLNEIAHYYRELNRKAPSSDIINDIYLEFYKLGPPTQVNWRKLTPEGPNLFRNGVVDFEVFEGAPYGIKLMNKGSRDLYPYLFYFNNNDLSIVSLYDTPGYTGYSIEAPLKKKVGDLDGILTLGYGSSGVPPWTYKLESEKGNVDFLKIISTTKPIDISAISHPSPFITRRAPRTWTLNLRDTWQTLVIPVIQRKPQGIASKHTY